MTFLKAVTLAVTLSILLLAGARPDPDLAEANAAAVYTAVRDPQEKEEIETTTTTVDLRRPIHLAAVDPEDLSRQIAHSFRLPLSHHASARPLRHVASVRPSIEIPYGHDMIGLPKTDKKKKKKLKKERDDESDSDSDSDDDDDDDFEIEQHKKMKKALKKMMKRRMKMEREKKEENSGFVNWISGFLNRF